MTTGFSRHKITVSGLTGSPSSLSFWFTCPKTTYDGLSSTATGVEKITTTSSADTTDETAPVCTVEALLKSGYAVRKVIAYSAGSGTTLKTRYARIIVAKDKAEDFAPSGTFRGGTIKRVVNPLDAVFS